jgi:hypothetical protein
LSLKKLRLRDDKGLKELHRELLGESRNFKAWMEASFSSDELFELRMGGSHGQKKNSDMVQKKVKYGPELRQLSASLSQSFKQTAAAGGYTKKMQKAWSQNMNSPPPSPGRSPNRRAQ